MRDDLSPEDVKRARLIAVAADVLQLLLIPAYFSGGLALAVDVVDVIAAFLLIRLLGWHWAFLPTFVAELTPLVDLVPTWTGAVFLATRRAGAPPEVVVETTARPVEPVRALPAPSAQRRRDPSGE